MADRNTPPAPGANVAYHLDELKIALDPSRPEHLMPELSSARLGVVDVGCGIGPLFVARGHEIPPGVKRDAFDVDTDAIDYAKARWPDKGEFGVAPAETLPLNDRTVDLYVARVTLQGAHIPAALREAARVLVPGGRLWITLHPVSMTLEKLGHAARTFNLREVIGQSIVLVNGLVFSAGHGCSAPCTHGRTKKAGVANSRLTSGMCG